MATYPLKIIKALCIIATCIGCSYSTPESVLYFTITVDEDFNVDQQQQIIDAIDTWQIATDKVFHSTVVTGPVQSGQKYAISAELYIPRTPEGIADGLSDAAGAHTRGAISLLKTMEDLGPLSLHELGHYFTLHHVENNQDIMHKTLPHGMRCLSWDNINTFCEKWDCADANVQPACLSNKE